MATYCQYPPEVGGGRADVTGDEAAQRMCVSAGGTLVSDGGTCTGSIGGPVFFPSVAALAPVALVLIYRGLRRRRTP